MSDIKAFLFDDDRGVSPVIGVILMVAITVILAAVIAAFVLGLGDTNSSAPNATFEFDYNESSDNVTATVTGGDTFDPRRVTVTGTEIVDNSSGLRDNSSLGDGESLTKAGDITAGDNVRAGDEFKVELVSDDSRDFELDIIFTSEDGGTSTEIGGTTGPDA